ncbi:MAG: helix-turn-helix domain-containing protein [Cyanobacteria bacterium REEB459]|nr:helix-turn-helix domain-containing protein [Cyanobacteria bacterium REEB459]
MTGKRCDLSPRLQRLMQRAGLTSYRALCQAAAVPRVTVDRLRQGQLGGLRVDRVQRLSRVLGTTTAELIDYFVDSEADLETSNPVSGPDLEAAARGAGSDSALVQQFQDQAMALLEPWLLQWPAAVYAAQHNPTLPASRLIPLCQPWQLLLASWQVSAIGTVGAEATYDPRLHQPLEGTLQPGQRVRIRYPGYRQGDRLLHRARVSLLEAGG